MPHVSHGVSGDWRNRVSKTCTVDITDATCDLSGLVKMAEAVGIKTSKVSVQQEQVSQWSEDGTRLVLAWQATDCKLCRANAKKNARVREATMTRNAERRRLKAEQQRA